MKKIIVSCAVLTLGAFSALAQSKTDRKPVMGSNDNAVKNTTVVSAEPQSPAHRVPDARTAEQRIQEFAQNKATAFKRQYNLTEKQYQGVYEATIDFTKKMEAIAAQGRQVGNDEYDQLMAEHDKKLKRALSEEQYAKYEKTRIKPAPRN